MDGTGSKTKATATLPPVDPQVIREWRRRHRLTHPLHRLAWRLNNPRRTLFVAVLGLGFFALLQQVLGWKAAFLVGWIVGAGSYMLLVALVAVNADSAATRRRITHGPRAVTVLSTIVISTLLSNICFGILLNSISGLGRVHDHVMITLCALAILLSWMLLHTGFGRYYSQVYYATHDHRGEPAVGGKRGGFSFPGTPEPSQLDFFYLAFMVGLTYSSSDVSITNRHVRKIVLLHSLLSFFFYSTVLASIANVVIAGI